MARLGAAAASANTFASSNDGGSSRFDEASDDEDEPIGRGLGPNDLQAAPHALPADSSDALNTCQWRYASVACCDQPDCGDTPDYCGIAVDCAAGEQVVAGGCRLWGDNDISLHWSYAYEAGDPYSSVIECNSNPCVSLHWYEQQAETGWECQWHDVGPDDGNPFTPPVFFASALALCCGD
jgi:hypothetical protein